MQKRIVVAAAVFLTGAGVCLAQPPGITREMISWHCLSRVRRKRSPDLTR